ncbi:MAG: hypothetical protein AAGG51_02205 [Cyanobacteria bacterium P01_G01_bin.54]
MPILIATTADDAHKGALVKLLQDYPTVADRYQFLATRQTGEQLQWNCEVTVTSVHANAEGGMVELVAGKIAAVIDLFEPTIEAIANPDRQALWRMCVLHNVPYASNLATATAILQSLGRSRIAQTIGTSKTRLEGMNALASLFAAAIVNSPSNREDVVCLRTPCLTLTTEPSQRLTIDGEMHQANPIVFECLPASLRVLVPLRGE